MKGNIYTRQKCWMCGESLVHDERRGGCFCVQHPKVAADGDYYVKFGRDINKRFSEYILAARFLTGLRFKSDENTYDPRDYHASNPLGFETLAKQFLEDKKKLGLKCLRNPTNYMHKAIDHFGQANVKTITKGDLKRYLYGIPNISEKTRANYASCLHDFFYNFLVDDEEILNLSEVPKIPKIHFELGYRKYFENIDDREKVVDKVKEISFDFNPKIWFGIELLCSYTMLRPMDLLNLTEGAIDIENRVITFFRPTKKRGQFRTLRVRLVSDNHVKMFEALKKQFPGAPAALFFRHAGGIPGTYPGKPFGSKYFWKWWVKACNALKIPEDERPDLYGGTRHTTVTAVGKAYGKDVAKSGSGHGSNKAFDRYCQVEDDGFEATGYAVKLRKKAEVIDLKKAKGGA